jgi:hypothetical protein
MHWLCTKVCTMYVCSMPQDMSLTASDIDIAFLIWGILIWTKKVKSNFLESYYIRMFLCMLFYFNVRIFDKGMIFVFVRKLKILYQLDLCYFKTK